MWSPDNFYKKMFHVILYVHFYIIAAACEALSFCNKVTEIL